MNLKPLKGQHHVSAVTANAKGNYEFYTSILGMRLVKKTVNQDDTSVYHLFYADERGNPGTDLTFFEIPHAGQTRIGTNSISLTSLRVPTDESIHYWKKRLEEYEVEHDEITETYGRLSLSLRDFEGQRLMLVSDEHNEGVAGGKPWDHSLASVEHAIIGLGPVQLTVTNADSTASVLTEVLGFREKEGFTNGDSSTRVFESGEGGSGGEIYVVERNDIPVERPGRGSVHHVAFRVADEPELNKWVDYLHEKGFRTSGFVERYYFKSLYFRDPNGILIELATDGPGFEGDEPFETLGEKLSLPPYFEDQRDLIEAKLEPVDTKLSDK